MPTFRRLLGFLRPYRGGVIWSLLLAAASMGMTVLIPWLTGRAVDAIQAESRSDLKVFAFAVVGAGCLRLILSVGRRLVSGQVSLSVERDLRNRMYRHLQSLEIGFFDQQQTGQLMSRATVDLQVVRFFLGYGLIFLIQSVLSILIAGGVMLALQPELAVAALSITPFVVLVAFKYGKIARPALQEVQQRMAELSADVEENVSGVRVVKAFAREEHQLERFRGSATRLFDQSMFSTRLRALYNPLIGFIPSIGLALVLLIGGRRVIDGSLTLGEFTAFYFYMLMLIGPLRMLGTTLGSAQRATAAGARIFELLDRAPTIEAGGDQLPDGHGEIVFDHVSFSYRDGHMVLKDVSFAVPAGTTVALVGPTGSGKTTLVSLLPRLYEVTEGQVLLDNADIRTISPGELRRTIAFVAEDSFLFSASLHENIAYGRPDASADEVRVAAERARISEFIETLPDKYDTVIGERGITLSGGQRQRVAIARALLADPRILILDDATSSVDARTEAQIKAALAEVMRGRTTFIIAHRLSTIALADQIVVIEEGRVAAAGSHDDLLISSPLYAAIATKGMPESVFMTRPIAPVDSELSGAGL